MKGEFINIGVVLRGAARTASVQSGDGASLVSFTRDWGRVRCMDADADIELLEALESEIAVRLHAPETGLKPVLEMLEDTLSNAVQITPARACLAESLVAEMEQLMRLYVEPMKVKLPRQRSVRAAIAATMRTEFERAGVWGLMRKRIAAATYTRPGDPMRIDCGYRAVVENAADEGMIRMFHAVSLEGDVEAAKVLAYSAPQLRDGVLRVEKARLELTAVVEPLRMVSGSGQDEDDEAGERYRFGVESMERQEIRVMTVADLARMAETARMELRV